MILNSNLYPEKFYKWWRRKIFFKWWRRKIILKCLRRKIFYKWWRRKIFYKWWGRKIFALFYLINEITRGSGVDWMQNLNMSKYILRNPFSTTIKHNQSINQQFINQSNKYLIHRKNLSNVVSLSDNGMLQIFNFFK